MKYCEEYAALLDLFVDGELPPDGMERVLAHLETCPGCQGYVDDAMAIRAGFPNAEDTVVPEGFAERIMERVREHAGKDTKQLKRRSARRWLGTFAALAACCGLVVLVRTSPDGLSNGDSAPMVTAGAGYAMDTGGVDNESDDAWNDLQTEMGPATAPEEAKLEEGAEKIEGEVWIAAAEMDRAAAMDSGDAGEFEKAASPSSYENLAVSPTAILPEDSADTAGSGEEALYLTAEEAGDLLESHTPVRETASERWYELTGEEYQSLLEALGRPAEIAAEPVLVVVAEPFE